MGAPTLARLVQLALVLAGVLGALGCRKDAPSVPSPVAPPVVPPVAPASDPQRVAPSPGEPRGRFVQSDAEPYAFAVEPTSIELGVLRPDEDAKCTFEIVNLDARPLRLVNVDGSCECVGFGYARGDLPPGSRRTVAVEVKAENRGDKLLTVYVQANDRVVTTREVAIRYSIEPDLSIEPQRADFGQRVVGSPGRIELSVRYRLPVGRDALALAPTWSSAVPATFELGTARAEPLAGGLVEFEQPLVLHLEASVPVAAFRTELLFAGRGHRRASLPVTGCVHGDAWLDPAELHLGVVEVGASRRGVARLRWTREPVDVEEITCSVPELRAQATPERGARALRIQVELEPNATGEFAGDVTIRTRQVQEPLVLRVRAKVR